MPHAGGTIPLAPGPGALVRIVFPLDPWQDPHPPLIGLEPAAYADWVTGGG
mgnify:CR=1 FL=1